MAGEQKEQPEETLEAQVAATPAEERGDKPLVVKGPTFELEGHTYTMRRLNYLDHSRFAGIIDQALRHGQIDLVGVASRGKQEEQMQTVITLLLGALTYAPTELFGFLASALEVSRPTLLDPERFPFASLPMVIGKLVEHPDLQDFFVAIGALLEGRQAQLLAAQLLAAQTPAPPMPPSSGPLISSADDTAIPTPQS